MSCHEIADLIDKYIKVGQVTKSTPLLYYYANFLFV